MHLQRMAHAVGHRTRINPASVAAKAVGVPEAVRNNPAAALLTGRTQLNPGLLSIQISTERITSPISTTQRRENDVARLPALKKLPVRT